MSASIFEQRLEATVKLARQAAEQAVSENQDTAPADIIFDHVEWSDVDILLEVTGEKRLDDQEEADVIVGLFEDTFYETLDEWGKDD